MNSNQNAHFTAYGLSSLQFEHLMEALASYGTREIKVSLEPGQQGALTKKALAVSIPLFAASHVVDSTSDLIQALAELRSGMKIEVEIEPLKFKITLQREEQDKLELIRKEIEKQKKHQ